MKKLEFWEISKKIQNFLIQVNDALSFAEMNNKKRSRNSSFCNNSRNGLYNMDYSNNNIINNNIINQNNSRVSNNRPLNTISNNYNTNINPLMISRHNLYRHKEYYKWFSRFVGKDGIRTH